MGIDVRRLLNIDRFDITEATQVLLENCSHRYENGREQQFFLREEGKWLKFQYTKAGNLDAILPSENVEDIDIKALAAEIDKALAHEQVTRVHREVVLSQKPVQGMAKGKCRGFEFQIVSLDPQIPASGFPQDHPFVLEAGYTSSPNQVIAAFRRSRSMTLAFRLLTLLLNTRIRPAGAINGFEWGFDDNAPAPFKCRWMRLGFFAEIPVDDSAFTPPASFGPLPQVEAVDYYSPFPRKLPPTLALPDIFEPACGRFALLDSDDFERLSIALAWFADALSGGLRMRSNLFNSLVSAIEALLPEHEEQCASCNQPVYKLGERFKTFLSEYAKGEEETPGRDALLKAFYRTRSRLSHGLSLLQADLEPWQIGHHREGDEQRKLEALFSTVRIAIINWLGTRTIPAPS